jgi:hypothetical protein
LTVLILIVLGVEYELITSDKAFDALRASDFDFIIVDPWTWAGKGWIVKPCIEGQEERIYVLDFFGFHKLPGDSLRLPDHRFLTAYGGSASNTFLGYYLPTIESLSVASMPRKMQGVIWGKDIRHFEGPYKIEMLRAIAEISGLVSTVSAHHVPLKHANIHWVGHQTRDQWRDLLKESRFMIGLGDPLLGPSAIDAISAGCVYINPIYDKPVRDGHFLSQHPYAAEKIGAPYVCSVKLRDVEGVLDCVRNALKINLPPINLTDFTEHAHIGRVKEIFHL